MTDQSLPWAGVAAHSVVTELERRRALRYDGELAVACTECGSWPDYYCVDGAGRSVDPHPRRQRAAQATRQHQADVERQAAQATMRQRLAAADVPELHVRCLLGGSILDTEPLSVTRTWYLSGEATLILVGARGVGKSLAAAWATGEGPRRRPPGQAEALWLVASELGAMDFYGNQRLESSHRSGLLVVDDVGMGELGDARRFWLRLETALAVRHDRALQTIVTCNMSIDEFRKVCDERVRDRISSSGTVYSVNNTRSLRTGRAAGQ